MRNEARVRARAVTGSVKTTRGATAIARVNADKTTAAVTSAVTSAVTLTTARAQSTP